MKPSQGYRAHRPVGAHGALRVALEITRKYGETPPTVDQLQRRYRMSRATAYRWRKAWLETRA